MRNLHPFRVLTPLLAVVALAAFGLRQPPEKAAAPETTTRTAPAPVATAQPRAAPADADPQLLQQNEDLAAMNRQLEGQLNDLLNWILDNFRGRHPVNNAHLDRLQFEGVTEAFTLDEKVAEFLQINDAERSQLNEAMHYAAQRIREMEHRRAALRLDARGTLFIEIPPFPESGGTIAGELYTAIDRALGSDRAERMIRVTDQGFLERFARFGDQYRTIQIELVQDFPDQPAYLLIQDGRTREQEDGTVKVETVQHRVDRLPDAYVEWEPAMNRLFEETL